MWNPCFLKVIIFFFFIIAEAMELFKKKGRHNNAGNNFLNYSNAQYMNDLIIKIFFSQLEL